MFCCNFEEEKKLLVFVCPFHKLGLSVVLETGFMPETGLFGLHLHFPSAALLLALPLFVQISTDFIIFEVIYVVQGYLFRFLHLWNEKMSFPRWAVTGKLSSVKLSKLQSFPMLFIKHGNAFDNQIQYNEISKEFF